MPEPTASKTQLENIDCLICHQVQYKRVKSGGVFVPDTANMAITMNQAVRTVHQPVRANCLQCHARPGGGDAYKRGDLALAHGNTTDTTFDSHMATAGLNLQCQDCHKVSNHRIAGRGSDIAQTDYDFPMGCSTTECHAAKGSPGGHTTQAVNRHVNRVACQTCHISTYGKNAGDTIASEATEIHRIGQIPTLTQLQVNTIRGATC
jgi:Zn finger protein HypA/HybF involved in hydrogenase expression